VVLHQYVDERILGRPGPARRDKLIDGSVQAQLEAMREKIPDRQTEMNERDNFEC